MHLGEISFCDRVGFNIKSDDVKRKILDDLEVATGFKVIQKHFERFDPQIVGNRINSMPHLLSLRSNGNPYLLYLTKYNDENQCIFIDKKVQHGYFYPRMILSKLWFDASLFDNTLLDGEMVRSTHGEWHFIINDIICLNNQLLDKHNIVKRLSIVYDMLTNKYKPDEFSCCKLVVKKYFTLQQVSYMLTEFMSTLPYSCRGVYFKPFYLKFKDILFNFDDSQVQKVVRFKYKHLDGQTFKESITQHYNANNEKDIKQTVQAPPSPPKVTPSTTVRSPVAGEESIFYVKKTSNTDIYELYESLNDQKTYGVALINSMKVSKMMKEIFRNLNATERLAMTCVFNEKFGKYVPVCKVVQA